MAFGPAADGAGQVQEGRGLMPSGQYEIVQGPDLGHHFLHGLFQPVDMPLIQHGECCRGQIVRLKAYFGPQIKQLVLDTGQMRVN